MMDTTSNIENQVSDAEFWFSLQAEMLNSKHNLKVENMASLVEQSFMFSLFFRNFSDSDLLGYQQVLQLKNYGYAVLIDISEAQASKTSKSKTDNLALYKLLKNNLKDINNAIGPLIGNRICILFTQDFMEDKDSRIISKSLIKLFNDNNLTATIGIGSITSLQAIYSSFLEAIRALSFCNSNEHMHVNDARCLRKDLNYDYEDTEKHLLDAIRQRKVEAFDYFGILMNWIAPFNDLAKRNYIVEILILAAHAMRIEYPESMKKFNPLGKAKELMECQGSELHEWAFRQFTYITGIVRPRNSIDLSNKIVRLTKEYLEAHYTEDISLEDVAAQVNVSPQYFSKLIKKNTGFNFIDWLSMMRVRRAKELFNTTNLSIKEVCFMIGYKDPNYFSRIFKKRVGITPSEYIKTGSFRKKKNK